MDGYSWRRQTRLLFLDDCDVGADQAHLVSDVLELEPDTYVRVKTKKLKQ